MLLSASWCIPKTLPHRPSRGLHSTAPPLPYSIPACAACLASATRASRSGAWGLQPRPRQALGVRVRETAVDDHDRDALSPGFSQVLRQAQRGPLLPALLQVGVAAAPWQGGLKRGELLSQV